MAKQHGIVNGLPIDDGRCFACGPYSSDGLHLRFHATGDDSVRAEIMLPPRFQGWSGVAHGGIVMTLLDEGMAHAVGLAGERGMTASVNVRFRSPVALGIPIVVTGKVNWKRRTVLGVESQVLTADGTVLAEAAGSFVSSGPLGEARLGLVLRQAQDDIS